MTQDAQKAAWESKDRAAKARKNALTMQYKDMKAFMYVFSAVDMKGVVNSR
jgi:hypothetical protein